jgi:AcrR family transcriptional regulator
MLVCTNMKSRPYTQQARAASAEATRLRVLAAAADLMRLRLRTDIRLADVAAGAGVSEMTVLRLFRTKEALLEAALEQVRSEIIAQRQQAEPGDIAGSVKALFEHYEAVGDLVIVNLAQEASDPSLAEVLALGRADHLRWVRRQFGPQLARRPRGEREQLVDALVVACDVYTWKRLRRDMGRSVRGASRTVQLIVEGVLDARAAEPV